MMYIVMQSSRVSCLAQAGFAAFGKGVWLISLSLFAETGTLTTTLASTSSKTFIGRGPEEAFNTCLGVNNTLSSVA